MYGYYKLRDWILIDKLDWSELSRNRHAIHLLEQNMDKIVWHMISENKNIFTYDYDKIKENMMNTINEELIAKVFNPDRLLRICEKYNIEFIKLMEIY